MIISSRILCFLCLALLSLSEAARNNNPTIPSPRYKLRCGTFIQYEDHDEVALNGFAAGVYSDGSTAYVGMGNNHECSHEYNAPARLKADNPKPGAYMSCKKEIHDTSILRYLAKHRDLKWIPRTGGDLSYVPQLLSIKSAQYTFYFGRKRLTKPDGTEYYVVSKVFPHGEMFYSEGNGYKRTYDIEVLSC